MMNVLPEPLGVLPRCEVLAWDSTFFGRRIGRYRKPDCDAEDVAAVAAECRESGIE